MPNAIEPVAAYSTPPRIAAGRSAAVRLRAATMDDLAAIAEIDR